MAALYGPWMLCLALLAASPVVAAHAQDDLLPDWIQSIFVFYAAGQISDAELVAALEYLVSTGVISTPGADSGGVRAGPADGKIKDRGDFYLEYGPNPNAAHEMTAAEWLKGYELLEYEVEWLNENFRLPHDVLVSAEECGEANAFYSPVESKVVVCYELVDDLFGLWYEYVDRHPVASEDFVYANTYAILYHEVGHALIDVYDLPYTGREENVVDQFSALILSRTYGDEAGPEFGQEMLYNVGNYYSLSAERSAAYSDQDFPYWDVHASDLQRFYNISCYAYGADPVYNRGMVEDGWLPAERAESCGEEYGQLAYAWGYLLQDYTNGFFD